MVPAYLDRLAPSAVRLRGGVGRALRFANLAQALTGPGDVIICPNPAYPIHAYGFIMAGGVIRHVPALSPEEYLSGISKAMKHSAPPPSVVG